MSTYTPNNRLYSSPPANRNVGMGYAWSDTIVNTGANPTLTGNWAPLSLDGSGYLKINPQASSVTYQSFITGTTGGQIVIPVGVYDWTVTVQSGTAFMNGFPVFAGNQVPMIGGLIGMGNTSNTPIVVGVTGGRILVTWDF